VALKNFPKSSLVVTASQVFNLDLGNSWVVELYCATINNFKNDLDQIFIVQCDKVWVTMLVAQQ
jgi:hypothetical protein